LLANAISCYLAQDYPSDRKELIILDDGCDYVLSKTTMGNINLRILDDNNSIYLVSAFNRYPTLTAKYNEMFRSSIGDIIVVWEDDDIYLPHHISAHVKSILHGTNNDCTKPATSKPDSVYSLYTGSIETELASGRFHASLAFTKAATNHKGWIETPQADFDQQFIQFLKRNSAVVDTCIFDSPSYCFRWGSTNSYHGQSFMTSSTDSSWYSRVPRNPGTHNREIGPLMDVETAHVYSWHESQKPKSKI
jgi:glycosyltransferase involved in cell wall biosynthesis